MKRVELYVNKIKINIMLIFCADSARNGGINVTVNTPGSV